jgi:hypothetical protein
VVALGDLLTAAALSPDGPPHRWATAGWTRPYSQVTHNKEILGIGGIATGGSTPGPTATTIVRSSTVSDNDGGGLGTDANMTLHLADSAVRHNTPHPGVVQRVRAVRRWDLPE